jgi:hypothetical protein
MSFGEGAAEPAGNAEEICIVSGLHPLGKLLNYSRVESGLFTKAFPVRLTAKRDSCIPACIQPVGIQQMKYLVFI